MNRIEIVNECIEKLTTTIQEQFNELELYKLELCKYQHITKLLLVLTLEHEQKLNICKVFDDCGSEDEIKETYLRLLNELK